MFLIEHGLLSLCCFPPVMFQMVNMLYDLVSGNKLVEVYLTSECVVLSGKRENALHELADITTWEYRVVGKVLMRWKGRRCKLRSEMVLNSRLQGNKFFFL